MNRYAEAGPPLSEARLGTILVHGRGASARGMMGLADALGLSDVHYRAPQADGGSWYPYSFLAPLEENREGIESGISTISQIIEGFEDAGFPSSRVGLIGFSQGACLVLEYAARRPRLFAGIAALSGGLIGNLQLEDEAPPEDKGFRYEGSLEGTPVFLGCSDVDAHIPVSRVHASAQVLEELGASVEKRIYPGMGHVVNDDEIAAVREMLADAKDA